MRIEQTVESELRGPGPSSPTCTPIPDYFHEKAKISKANTRVLIYC